MCAYLNFPYHLVKAVAYTVKKATFLDFCLLPADEVNEQVLGEVIGSWWQLLNRNGDVATAQTSNLNFGATQISRLWCHSRWGPALFSIMDAEQKVKSRMRPTVECQQHENDINV